MYYIVLTVMVALAFLVGRRAPCHYICWVAPFMIVGTWLRDRLRLPGLRLRADSQRCIDCLRCTRACTMSLDVHAMVKRGNMRDAECVLCGLCADTCPQAVIGYAMGVPRRAECAPAPRETLP